MATASFFTATITGQLVVGQLTHYRPIHVHVRYGNGEAVFDVEHAVELRESYGLKVRELGKAEELATERRQLIIQKWHEHFDR